MKIYYPLLLITVLGIAIILRFYQLPRLMVFIGDQGWFYLSARDALLTGNIPLVGITASHTWLHQGALWTYILAILFRIWGFNPLIPGYFTATAGVFTVWLVYQIASSFFSRRIGLIACLLYATSPFIINSDRIPYHTSLIPLFSLLYFYCLVNWVKGRKYYFPLTVLCLTILYNFELATVSLWFVFLLTLLYGLYKKKKWVLSLQDKYVLFFSFLALVIPMIPMLLYDIHHGFPQTFKFTAWLVYHFLGIVGFHLKHAETSSESILLFLQNNFFYNERFIFLQSGILALVLMICSLITLLVSLSNRVISRKEVPKVLRLSLYECTDTLILFSLWVFVPFASYLANTTTSGAYLPVMFPSFIIMTALFFDRLLDRKRVQWFITVVLIYIAFSNSYLLIRQNYFMNFVSFADRMDAAKLIVKQAKGMRYTLVGVGNGSQFASMTMNTSYLTWLFGNGPSNKKEKLVFTIKEDEKGIHITKFSTTIKSL